MIQPPFLSGEKVFVRALTEDDVTPAYLYWLNNPAVLRYRSAKAYPSTAHDMMRYISSINARGDLVLAICPKATSNHVGNIALNTILWAHRSAELSIMIGAPDYWGCGFGTEAIQLVTAHAFESMGLYRVWAESPNPAFNAIMRKLGWRHEGTKRRAFMDHGAFVNVECWAVFADEFFEGKEMPK